MKNLLKFFVFVAVLSLAISLLYDYQMQHGGLGGRRVPEKYTLAKNPAVNPSEVASLESLDRERRALIKSVIPAVVAVKTTKTIAIQRQQELDPFELFFRRPRQFRNPQEQALVQNSLGSGVIVTNEGHIITNNHVVDQVDQIEVQLSDGRVKKARLIGADSEVDLAVLKIDDPGVKPLKLADSDMVQAGDFVLAVGNPFGFEETVTNGIISSRGRPNRADVFGDLIQTDAAINPGNSGGPLINVHGEVIGINTAIISRSGGSQGIGFAIPSNTVRTALESLLKHGRIIRGYLGIETRAPQTGQPNQNNGNKEPGVVVESVLPGSPAEEAHLQSGDVISKFNGHEVTTLPELRTLVAQVEPNTKVPLEIVRDGKAMNVTAEIKEQPANFQTSRAAPQQPAPQAPSTPGQQQSNTALASIHVAELTPEITRQLDLPNRIRGVVITGVDPDSGAAELRKGDVIEQINQQAVTSVPEYDKIASSVDPNEPVVLSVCRHRARSFLVLHPQ